MDNSIEFDKCDVCGKDDYLERTYFEYDIKCDCHSPRHFKLVRHCKDCIPSIPTKIHPYIKAMDGKSYKTTITNILPIEIVGEFIITEPIIQEQPMTHEEICTYEVCKLAKEKGFNVPTHYAYNENCRKAMYMELCLNRNTKDSRSISAPTQSLLQRWLREEKALHIQITLWGKGWYYDIWAFKYYKEEKEYSAKMLHQSSDFDTYELALEGALKYALENLVKL